MEKFNISDYNTAPSPGYLSCDGCNFIDNEFANGTICKLDSDQFEKINHLHGNCAENDHIYHRITNDGGQST